MPGGSNYRQWYAARKAMQERGTWRGRGGQPTHSVPALEEGEPPAQQPRLEEPEAGPSTPDSLPELENSPTAEGMAYTNGFSVLAWVKDNTPLIPQNTTLNEDAQYAIKRQLLLDFCCLLNMRWNMDCSIHTIEDTMFAFGKNNRFGVSDRTLKNAIGDLTIHIDFIRGSPDTAAEDLANYKRCKEKWNVPDQISESSFGWDPQEPAGTSTPIKRKRF
nr:nonstructural protein 3 [Bird parvovirus]